MTQNHKNPLKSCPICQMPTDPAFGPFCSGVCKNIDLIRWFKEDYRLPSDDPLKEEDVLEENSSAFM